MMVDVELPDSPIESESEAILLPSELAKLSSLLDEKPETFATGDKEIEEAALAAAKYIFDLSELRLLPCNNETKQDESPLLGELLPKTYQGAS